jgi:hypothetical protein
MAGRDFTEKEFKDIQLERHQFYKIYDDKLDSLIERGNTLEKQSIELFTTFLTSIGIIAGFGFTALGNVTNIRFFFLAESLLLFLIIYGLFILLRYNKARKKQLNDEKDYNEALLSPRLNLYKKFLTLEISKKELYEKLNEDDKRIFNLTPNPSNLLELDKHFIFALIILIIGVVLLLTSFINFQEGTHNNKFFYHHRIDKSYEKK